MAEKIVIDGNEAIARGAIQAGCKYFFGYPITPQNEIPEFMSRELPKIGGSYVQSESETGAAYMVYGGALAGARVMTSTSSAGFSLMQEGISYMAEAEMPAVVVNVMRMGPGVGTGGGHAQTDYRQVTKGGGHGAYRCIVLAPYSAQECYDFMQLAFYLADKYRIVVLVVSDFVLGRTAELVELKTIEFGPLPEKDWALKGTAQKGGKRRGYVGMAFSYQGPHVYHQHMIERYQTIVDSEVRYDTYKAEDAELLLLCYGSTARMAKGAVDMARAEGFKVGIFRPISLWPFPEEEVRQAASAVGKVLVIEDSPGELVEDVRNAVQGRVPVHLLGIGARQVSLSVGALAVGKTTGYLYPERILEEVKRLHE